MDTKKEMRAQSIALNGFIKILISEGVNVKDIVSRNSYNFLDDSSSISEAVKPEYKLRAKEILEEAVESISYKD